MNAMAECWPLRLNVCKSFETVRRGRTPGLAIRVIHLLSRLRRVNRMCSSTLSVNCEYFTK